MDTKTVEQSLHEIVDQATAIERCRCVGVVLAYVGAHRLARHHQIVQVLESIATDLEHPEGRDRC